ncbi:MAG: GerMN domain-containing protein [Actinomycetota bacterium]|nr:GerMN domain-containing protein [Actinomycetota bacterium]
MTSRPSRRTLTAALLTISLLCAACGLKAEKQPHEISDRALTDLLATSSSTTTPSGDAEQDVSLYFVRGEKLEEITVPVAGRSVTVERVLTLLLNGPPSSAEKGLTTSIPPQTSLRSATLHGSTLRIDLSGDIKSLGGSAAKAAYAQLVFTALGQPGVQSVRFAIEGEDIDGLTDDGSLSVIQAKNYKRPLNPN